MSTPPGGYQSLNMFAVIRLAAVVHCNLYRSADPETGARAGRTSTTIIEVLSLSPCSLEPPPMLTWLVTARLQQLKSGSLPMQSECVQSDGSSTSLRDLSRSIAMADEVATLKRELEELKLQLEQERKKNVTVQRESGPATKQEPKPERGSSQCDESNKSKRRVGKKAAPSSLKESRIYVQHAAVGSRRGKWWLRERQVLSRAAADEDGAETLKVRETWVWSGRTVILDKIVRLDEKQGEEPSEEVDQVKLELENDANGASPVKGLEGAAQPSTAAETSEAASSTAGKEVVDSNVVVELSMPPVAVKADDEVRESSAPVEPLGKLGG